MFGQEYADVRQGAVQLWSESSNDEERMEACQMLEKCAKNDLESLHLLSSWLSELGETVQVMDCCREGADVWSDLKFITALVYYFKNKPEEEESFERYVQQGANMKDPALTLEYAHYLQGKWRSEENEQHDLEDEDCEVFQWSERAALVLQDAHSLRFLAEWSKEKVAAKERREKELSDAIICRDESNDGEGALSLYLKAGKAGDIESFIIAASMLLNGIQCKPDPALAIELLAKAARLTFDFATMVKIGRCLSEDDGLPEDSVAAFSLFEEAARNGDVDARFHLAECLYRGYGVAENKAEAKDHYQGAVDAGCIIAIPALARCELEGGNRDVAKELLTRFFTTSCNLEVVITEESINSVLDEM